MMQWEVYKSRCAHAEEVLASFVVAVLAASTGLRMWPLLLDSPGDARAFYFHLTS
jgi:hypothetical protein